MIFVIIMARRALETVIHHFSAHSIKDCGNAHRQSKQTFKNVLSDYLYLSPLSAYPRSILSFAISPKVCIVLVYYFYRISRQVRSQSD